MISPNTIRNVTDKARIEEIVQHLVPDLKRKGTGLEACCPFHNEKTPSFRVNTAKGIYKCFGCGKAGGVVNFVMEHQQLKYPEAIKWLADYYKVPVEYDKMTEPEKEEYLRKEKEKENMRAVLTWAKTFYYEQQIPEPYLASTGITEQSVVKFELGYAPSKNNVLLQAAEKYFSIDMLVKAGLVAQGDNGYYDVFRGRVMYPVLGPSGQIEAFTGRIFPESKDKKVAKWLHSNEKVWQRNKIFFGLFQGYRAIRTNECAYTVEGPKDVVLMQQEGVENTIAGFGTEITLDQVKELSRYTKKVVIAQDGDAAGMKSLDKSAALFLQEDFKVRCLIPDKGKDPAEMCVSKAAVTKWLKREQDYLSEHLIDKYFINFEGTPDEEGENAERLYNLLVSIPNEARRNAYIDSISYSWKKWKKLVGLAKKEKEAKKSNSNNELVKKLDHEVYEEYFKAGFITDNKRNVYQGKTGPNGGQWADISTFIMNMLFFVKAGDDTYYLTELTNFANRKRICYIHTDNLTSVGALNKQLAKLGDVFLFRGKDDAWMNVRIKQQFGVPEAVQPPYMGFNKKHSIYVWANGLLHNGDFVKADKYGVVKLRFPIQKADEFIDLQPGTKVLFDGREEMIADPKEYYEENGDAIDELIEEKKCFRLYSYYLPFASQYQLSADAEESDDTLKKFKHFNVEGLTLANWVNLMARTYGDNGKIASLFYLSSIYRDIIYQANGNYFPLLFFFGMPQSGKSTCAHSLASMFGEVMEDGINLESGSTTTGIRRYTSSTQNGMIWLNEYKNTLHPQVIGLLKSLADGAGKLTGMKTSGAETKSYKPKSAVVIAGQDLPTVDPALLTRCIVCEFTSQGRNEEAFVELKAFEKAGATTAVTCSALAYRSEMEQFPKIHREVGHNLKVKAKGRFGSAVTDRLIVNNASLLATLKILIEAGVPLPYTYEDMEGILLDRMSEQINMQTTADDIAQFLSVIMNLRHTEFINGEHYKIERDDAANNNRRLFYLRLRQAMGLYREHAKKQGITPLSEGTVGQYLKRHAFFIEHKEQNVDFDEVSNTSAYVLDYEKMSAAGFIFRSEHNKPGAPGIGKREEQGELKLHDTASGFNPPTNPYSDAPSDDLPF